MTQTNPVMPDVENPDNLRRHRREWAIQRIGWGAIAIVLLLALLGLFGSGPLSRARAASADGLVRLDYQRFTRMHAPTTLRLVLTPAAAGEDGLAWLWIDAGYLGRAEKIEVIPPAAESRVRDGRCLYAIRIAGRAPVEVRVRFDPGSPGIGRGELGLEGPGGSWSARGLVRFRQLTYP